MWWTIAGIVLVIGGAYDLCTHPKWWPVGIAELIIGVLLLTKAIP